MPKCNYCGEYIGVGQSFIDLNNITAHVDCLNDMDVDTILLDLDIGSNTELCGRLGYPDKVMEGEEDWTI